MSRAQLEGRLGCAQGEGCAPTVQKVARAREVARGRVVADLAAHVLLEPRGERAAQARRPAEAELATLLIVVRLRERYLQRTVGRAHPCDADVCLDVIAVACPGLVDSHALRFGASSDSHGRWPACPFLRQTKGANINTSCKKYPIVNRAVRESFYFRLRLSGRSPEKSMGSCFPLIVSHNHTVGTWVRRFSWARCTCRNVNTC